MGSGLKLLGKPTDAEWQRFADHADGNCLRLLASLHEKLAEDNRHFGYRVAREVARFVDLAAEQTTGTSEALLAAFDVALQAKVLPKLHGTQAELEEVLAQLFVWSVGVAADTDDVRHLDGWRIGAGVLVSTSGMVPKLPRTALKLFRMRRRLRAQGYVSFIE